MIVGNSVSDAWEGLRRRERREDLAPSGPMRWEPVAVVPSEKVVVTEVDLVEKDASFLPC